MRPNLIHSSLQNHAAMHAAMHEAVHIYLEGPPILQFDQSSWMESYICIYMELHMLAKTTSKQDFLKLMNNFMFRKSMKKL